MDNSNPKPMEEKWGFVLNKSFVTAYGVHEFKLANRNISDNVIVFAFETVSSSSKHLNNYLH